MDQPAVGGVALHDPRVELDAEAGWQPPYRVREEGLAAHIFEPVFGRQLVRHRDLVDRIIALPEVGAGFEHPAVLLAEEIVGFEDAVNADHRLRIDHQRRYDCFFSLNVMRG